ncbi:MAG TPA: serine hydrolase [Allosphingosinicella sp.]|jgi:CubicO group peptidase (beta-lactamase class C family)
MRILLALFCLLLAAPAAAQSADPLIGLWGLQLDFGPELRGELVVRRSGRAWTARIGDARTSFAPVDGQVRFDFAGRGAFRGRLTAAGLEGFWLQPSGAIEDRRDPGGSGQPFATPLFLRPAGPGELRAAVVPLDGRYTLWLSIFRAPDGALMAAFRNPEMNSNGGASRFNVSREGDAVRFRLRHEGGEVARDATFLRSPDRLRIHWPDLERTVELTRRARAEAAAFFPRPPGAPLYFYARPPQLADGWRTARAADTGLAENALRDIVRSIAASDPTARPPVLMHSILVAHRGRLVLEEYFFGHDRETPHDMRSAGKTFGSVLLGTAPARRAGLSPDTPIYELLRGRGPFANPDPRKGRITLSHLLTHSSGLACNDYDADSPGNEGTMQNQQAQPDWWRYTLDLPMAHEPGARYAYCSANSNLVGAALTHATRIWLPELFRREIAEPLRFGRWHWNLMPSGEGYLGGGAFLLPRDFLKIGQLFLDDGVWNGRRIVPADWVRVSTAPRMEISPATTGISEAEFGNSYGRGHDGLAWHVYPTIAAGRTYASYEATGNGGQVLVVVPELDLAVAFTGGNYMQGGVWGRWRQQIVGDRIIPAIATGGGRAARPRTP